MQQLSFKSRDQYVEWRAHWRKQMNNTSLLIRWNKMQLRITNNEEKRRGIQSVIKSLKMVARCLMMSRTAVDQLYKEQLVVNNTTKQRKAA